MPHGEIFGLLKLKIPNIIKDDKTGAFVVSKDALLEAARVLISHPLYFNNLHCITAVDRKESIELIYNFYSIEKRLGVKLKIPLAYGNLEIESLSGLWRSADWLEREVYDLFGVIFLNHPNLKRILNPDEWDVHPLRKDFEGKDFVKKPRY